MKKILLTIISIFFIAPAFAQNVGIGGNTPQQKLEIVGTTNTIRIDGIGSTPAGSFFIAPSATTDHVMFSNITGDIKSMPNGSAGNVLTLNGSGIISWMTPATSGTVTNFTAGTLSPLFTTSVATSGTTPALTFTQSSVGTGNFVYASPNGAAGVPTFRSLVSADIPDISAGYVKILAKDNAAGTGQTGGFDMISDGEIGGNFNVWGNFGVGVNNTSATNAKFECSGAVYAQSGFKSNNGGIATPGYRFQNDANSGLILSGGTAGKIGVVTTNLERFKFTTVGLSINPAGAVADPTYALDATSVGARTINGVNTLNTGYGVVGFNTAADGTTTAGAGVFGQSGQTAGYGVYGANTVAGGIGISGNNTAASGAGNGIGVFGSTAQSGATSAGIKGQNSNAAWWAIVGLNTAASGAGVGGGVFGQSAQSGSPGAGVYGVNTNNAGVGVWGVNSAASSTGIGAGVVGISNQSGAGSGGLYGQSNNASGTGVYGAGQAVTATGLAAGQGGAFNGLLTGAYIANTSLAASQAIYSNNGGTICRVNYWNGATQYKILGTGTVSTVAKNLQGDKVVLHCPETPEIYFSDYGNGQLINGKAHIDIDPIITKNIVVDADHPLQVIIQLNGDCKGVYVPDLSRSANGFDVVELQGGTSNVPFTWNITANRADEDLGGGRISQNANVRFELAPKDEEINSSIIKTTDNNSFAAPTISTPK